LLSLRTFATLFGAAAAVVGLVFIVAVPISLQDSAGQTLQCGTAFKRDEQAAADYQKKQQQEQLAATLDIVTGKVTGPGSGTPTGGYTPVAVPDCNGALNTRRMWTIPLAAIGAVMLIGALVVRTPARGGRVTAAAPTDNDSGSTAASHY
jgi:hypothetical protein